MINIFVILGSLRSLKLKNIIQWQNTLKPLPISPQEVYQIHEITLMHIWESRYRNLNKSNSNISTTMFSNFLFIDAYLVLKNH